MGVGCCSASWLSRRRTCSNAAVNRVHKSLSSALWLYREPGKKNNRKCPANAYMQAVPNDPVSMHLRALAHTKEGILLPRPGMEEKEQKGTSEILKASETVCEALGDCENVTAGECVGILPRTDHS